MSAGVDQKPKSQRAQVQNGPVNTKEGVSDEDFERYMQTSQANQRMGDFGMLGGSRGISPQGYTAPNMAPTQDYLPSYYPSYSFQYSMPGSETTWSTGGDFNNFNYGTYDNSYAAENYYNQPGTTPPYLNQGLNFFPGNADFMTGSWSNSSAPGPQGQQPQQVTSRSQPAAQGTSYYDYARYPNASQQQVAPGGQRGYQGINGLDGHDGKAHGMKAVEQGMSGLNIGAAGDKQNAIGGVMTQNTHGMRSEQEMVRGQQVTTSSMAQQAPPPPASAPVTAAKPQSWAAIASKPAKPQPKMKTKTGSHAPVPTQLPPMKQTMTIGTWNGNDKQGAKPATTTAASVVQQPQVQQPPHSQSQSHGQGQGGQSNKQQEHGQGQQSGPTGQQQQQQQQQQHQNRAPQQSQQQQRNHGNPPNQHQQMQQRWSGSNNQGNSNSYANRSSGGGNSGNAGNGSSGASGMSAISVGQAIGGAAPQNSQPSPVLDKLRSTNTYNPNTFNLDIKNSRMFIIKSYSEDDIHRSIKYGIWCSTEHGNKRLDSAFRERTSKGPIYLLYSVNGSGHFCGVAEMMSVVDYNVNTGVWMQDKWKGRFDVRWVYVKDVPNSQLRHIRLENNDNKPVTNSRDTQEVPLDKGRQVLKIIHAYRHTTSIFDDFGHYEKRQEEDTARKPSGRDRRAQHRN